MRERPAPLHRLATRAGSLVDGVVVKFMNRAMSRSAPRRRIEDPRALLEKLGEVYGRPEFFADPDAFFTPPPEPHVLAMHQGDLPGGGAIVDLAYRSAWVPHVPEFRDEWLGYTENLTAHARWMHAARVRPTVILLHGWGGGSFAFEERAFVARYWLRAGLDVVLFQLPFHGRRAPQQAPRSGALFPSPHVVRTNEAFAQAVSDLRALMMWLRERDVPAIGAMGMSLGGYTTALLASVARDLAFAVPMIPAVSMSDLMWRHGEGTASRRRAEEQGVTKALLDGVFRVHAPLARAPRVARDRRYLIAGRGDRITPPDQAKSLWEHWERPPIHWFPGGHLAQVGRGDAFRALRRWFTERGVTS